MTGPDFDSKVKWKTLIATSTGELKDILNFLFWLHKEFIAGLEQSKDRFPPSA
jgi:hypothetical protein